MHVCSLLFSVNRMNDPLGMIPSDNDSTDSETEIDPSCCKILICSRKSSPGKQSDKVYRFSRSYCYTVRSAIGIMLSVCLNFTVTDTYKPAQMLVGTTEAILLKIPMGNNPSWPAECHPNRFYWLRQVRRVRRFLDDDAMKTLVHAFVTSRVDYCNAVFAGSPKSTTDTVQRALNAAAPLVSNTHKYDRGLSSLLHDQLHWLDVPERVE